MRRIAFLVITLIIGILSCSRSAVEVDVMTFNIRYATLRDSSNYWEFRKDQVVELIAQNKCDFVGLQEALPVQIEFLADTLDQYGFLWRTREINPKEGEAAPIIYLKDKWELLSSETFWLSDTPEIAGSNTWNAACNRVATWGLFRSVSSDQRVFVCNTHFDHVSQEARLKGAQLIIDRISEIAEKNPIVLLGDLNGKPDNPAIDLLCNKWYDPYPDFYPGDTINGTFHGFKGNPLGRRIDYILVDGQRSVSQIEIVRTNTGGAYPSDHFPVKATISF